MLPKLVLHADWSVDPKKRWVASATLRDNVYEVFSPELADADSLVSSALRKVNGGNVLIGFDFPIGLPRMFTHKAGISNFLQSLPEFGYGRWQRFYELASRPDEISIGRPFYPKRPGGTRKEHLVRGLGLSTSDSLLRRCERGNAYRSSACALFWTLGGNQVGRAAISGWRQILVPAIRSFGREIGIWPFEGAISRLLATRSCVIAETYPADACFQLRLSAPGRGWSKRRQHDRKDQGKKIQEWGKGRPVELRQVKKSLDEGFGGDKVGEDRFDAVVGLLGMLDVTLDCRGEGTPQDESVRTVEGWILGLLS